MSKRIRTIIALGVMIAAILGVLIYFTDVKIENNTQKKLKEFDLLDLYAENNDLVGWIHINDTGIDYPVMNSDYYLYRSFTKEDSKSGTPFVSDGYDPDNLNILIYGHNMRYDQTVFYDLTKYKNKDFFDTHKEIDYYAICDTDDNKKYVDKRTYQIIGTIITDTKEWHYWDYTGVDVNIDEYITEIKNKRLYDTGVEATGNLITLSTCYRNLTGETGRLVVVGTAGK